MAKGIPLIEFCKKYGIKLPDNPREKAVALRDFADYIRANGGLNLKRSFGGALLINEEDERRVLECWNELMNKRREEAALLQEEEAFLRQEEERIAATVQSMPITSTNGFEGYRITEYDGYVSGDEAIELADGAFGGKGNFNKDAINDKIKEIRSIAIDELKTAAAQIGCNAVIGLDFDYVTVDRQQNGLGNTIINRTFIILTANGTAVTIERI